MTATAKVSPCKAIIEAQKVQGTIKDLNLSMRRLRSALIQCETCPDQNCPLIVELNSDITSAILELTQEFNL
jgi:ribosomal protein S1